MEYQNKCVFKTLPQFMEYDNPKKAILVKLRLQKVDLGKVGTKKWRKNFKNSLIPIL